MDRLKNAAERRKEQIRQRLKREYDKVGVDVIVKRKLYKSDGSNGFIPDGTKEYKLRGLLQSCTQTSSKQEYTVSDGGRTYNITDQITLLYDEKLDLQLYDSFETGGKIYTFIKIQNVGEQNVYYLISLTTDVVEVPKYGK